MNISRKQKLIIVGGIGIFMVVYGLLDAYFKFNIDEKTVSDISLILMILAFGVLFSGRNKKAKNSSTETSKEDKDNLEQ